MKTIHLTINVFQYLFQLNLFSPKHGSLLAVLSCSDCALHYPLQAKCIKTGPGSHTCQCLAGWKMDEDGCQPVNDCLGPDRGGCHPNATCIYVGPGQVREGGRASNSQNSLIDSMRCCFYIFSPTIYLNHPFNKAQSLQLILCMFLFPNAERLCVQEWFPWQWEGVRGEQSVRGTKWWLSLSGGCPLLLIG